MATLFGLMLVLPQLAGAQTPAPSQALPLSGLVRPATVSPYLTAARDPTLQLTAQEIAAGADPGFATVTGASVDFGYTQDAVWVRLPVVNIAEETSDWRLHIQENFFQYIDVFVLRADGQIDHVLHQRPDSGFSTRPIAYGQLVAPFDLAPGQEATILLRYRSGGSTGMAFGLDSAAGFAATAQQQTARNAVFYGMMALLIVFAFSAMVVLRAKLLAGYVAYSTSVLLFLLHADGAGFQYLWPSVPQFNNNASILFGAGVVIFAAQFARLFVETARHHPWLDRLLLGIIAAGCGLLVGSAVLETQLIKKLLVMMALVSILACLVTGLVAARQRFKKMRFFILAWAGAVASVTLMWLRHWLGFDISQELQHNSMRLVMVFDASMMGLAILDHYNQLRASRQAALEDNLTASRRNLLLTQRMVSLEQKFSSIVETQQSRDIALANAIHDLRQPLHALRLRLVALRNGADDPAAQDLNLEDTFDYLEGLVGSVMARQTVSDSHDQTEKFTKAEAHGVQDILEFVHDMFAADAAAKGIDLRFMRRPKNEAQLQGFGVMRLMSNLVSNAVKYTPKGHVYIASRRSGSHLYLMVRDTGVGIPPGTFAKAQERSVRLDAGTTLADGDGLGLAIASALARQNGWTLTHHARRQGGSLMCLSVPIRGG